MDKGVVKFDASVAARGHAGQRGSTESTTKEVATTRSHALSIMRAPRDPPRRDFFLLEDRCECVPKKQCSGVRQRSSLCHGPLPCLLVSADFKTHCRSGLGPWPRAHRPASRSKVASQCSRGCWRLASRRSKLFKKVSRISSTVCSGVYVSYPDIARCALLVAVLHVTIFRMRDMACS